MNKPSLISVIVPAYNAGKYIEGCVESVLSQTYTAWELIVVDDGSKDGTYESALKLAESDDRINVIHTENGGVCSARNTGLEAAKGEYVTFLDVDDRLEPDALRVLTSVMTENNSDIAIGQCTRFRENGESFKSKYSDSEILWKDKEALVASLEDHPATYSVWGKLYRRGIIGDTRFDVGRRVHEDSFFLFELLLKCPTVSVGCEYVYRYFITPGSASRAAFSDKFFDILYFADRKKRLIEDKFPELIGYIPNLLIKANMALLSNLKKTKDKKYAPSEKQCIKEIKKYKKHFKPASNADKKWFWIITHGLYKPYRFLVLLLEG